MVERINGFFVAFWLSSFDCATKCNSERLVVLWRLISDSLQFSSKPEELPLGVSLLLNLYEASLTTFK